MNHKQLRAINERKLAQHYGCTKAEARATASYGKLTAAERMVAPGRTWTGKAKKSPNSAW